MPQFKHRITFCVLCVFVPINIVKCTNSSFISCKNETQSRKSGSTSAFDKNSVFTEKFDRIRDGRQALLLEVVESIRKLSGYLAEEAENGNDDLFFTLRMSQGQLWQLRAEAPQLSADWVVDRLLTEAEAALTKAGQVLEESFKKSPKLGPEFSVIMDPARGRTLKRLDSTSVIDNFDETWRLAFELNLPKVGSVMEFRPGTSDLCIGQLRPLSLGDDLSSPTGRRSYCPIDYPCWLMMTKPDAPGYYLTHQVMFLGLGETLGCGPDFEAIARLHFGPLLPHVAGALTPEIMRRQCRNVLQEARAIAAAGYPDILKDMFLEQGFLCGAAVYMPEFFASPWIRTVLSWQKPSGCFGFDSSVLFAQMKMRRVQNWADNDDNVSSAKRSQDISTGDFVFSDNLASNFRREKLMTESCYAHNSGVALGYLSVALRYLILDYK